MSSAYRNYPLTYNRLEMWGEWSKDSHGMGFSSSSSIEMFREGGGIDTKGSGFKYIVMTKGVDEIDEIVLKLKNHDRELFDAIKLKFINQWPYERMGGKRRRFRSKRYAIEVTEKAVKWIDERMR